MKLINLNIERSGHLKDRVFPFLTAERPDVLCLQELCEPDIPRFEDLFGQPVHFAPMCRHPHQNLADDTLVTIGVGMVAPKPLETPLTHYYRGSATPPIPAIELTLVPGTLNNYTPAPHTLHQAAVSGTVGGYRILTSHLVVTAQGQSSPEQLALAEKLLTHAEAQAQTHGNALLCGDLNAPRGRETWALMARRMKDNIPAHWATTLDAELHRAGPLPYVVDACFTLGPIALTRIEQRFGLSDHCALVVELAS